MEHPKPQALVVPISFKSCPICGGLFCYRTGFRKRVYCSAACARQCYGRPMPTDRKCKECGAAFTSTDGALKRYCSLKCKAKTKDRRGGCNRRRARTFGVGHEPIRKELVFERDRWRCQMCGVKCAKSEQGGTHPLAPELDHRIPMAMGGDHSYANVQTSCRRCNGSKGARRAMGQLPLVAKPWETLVA